MINAGASALPLSNDEIGKRLAEIADLLESQRANEFRVQAWRAAAATVRALDRPVAEILQTEGAEGIDRLPGIGPVLTRAIRELTESGRYAMLDRLRGESDPAALLASVPGIGKQLAQRLHDQFDIETLEQLETAAHDGRLARVPGLGAKRIAGIRDALATRLRGRRSLAADVTASPPGVGDLLEIDRDYRLKATSGVLPTIAPRRFNPTGERWLPVYHVSRGDRHYTALFSNTALAHQMGRTHDWVVIYDDGPRGEHRSTVITATRGPLKGRRIVRGREAECVAHYELNAPGVAAPAGAAMPSHGAPVAQS